MTTEQHLSELETEGYTVLPDAMTSDQLRRGREAVDALIAAGQPYGGAFQNANLTNRDPVFRELVQHPDLLAIVDAALGNDCILSGVNHRSSTPGATAQGLHRDTSIWGPSMFHLDKAIGINVGWAFDDFTEENGATRIIPGSHRRPDASADEPSIPLLAKAGSIFAFDGQLLHGGGANTSSGVRRAAFVFYIRSWIKPQSDHKRSTDRAVIESASPTLLRLLGFQRQSPVEFNDGHSEIVPAPGATWFYGETKTT